MAMIAPFLLALQLCRAESAQCAEDFIAQHRQQPECNVVVAVLLKKRRIPRKTPQPMARAMIVP